jgi:hypothetical protein
MQKLNLNSNALKLQGENFLCEVAGEACRTTLENKWNGAKGKMGNNAGSEYPSDYIYRGVSLHMKLHYL